MWYMWKGCYQMNYLYCGGNNEVGLPVEKFRQLFIIECQKEGQIVSMQFLGNSIGLAVVVKR